MTLQHFLSLCARAWSIPALALIYEGVPARLTPLATAAGASRAAMDASLTRCEELGLLERNPGHGHPLRPALVLTRTGRDVARLCAAVLALLTTDDERKLARRSWALPVIVVMANVAAFGELRRQLTPVTDRALSQCLKELLNVGWVERVLDDTGDRPRLLYRCSAAGTALHRALSDCVPRLAA